MQKVPPRIAREFRKKGFDYPCDSVYEYSSKGRRFPIEVSLGLSKRNSELPGYKDTAPTYEKVNRWLVEKRLLISAFEVMEKKRFTCMITDDKSNLLFYELGKTKYKGLYATQELAYNAGYYFILKNKLLHG